MGNVLDKNKTQKTKSNYLIMYWYVINIVITLYL